MGWSLVEGFTKSLAMTVLSEIGDKTFFTAAILAMRHPRRIVLSGCLSALIVMTILSACLGWAAPNLVSRKWAHHVTTVLFFGFGFWSLWEGFKEDGEAEELAEVEAKLDADWKAEKGEAKSNSKLATIGLATDENPFGVILGGVIGQALCTTAAVLGGKSLASQISEKMQLSGVAIPDLLKSNLYNVQKTIDRYRMHTKEPGSTKKAIEQSIQETHG